MTTSHPSPQRSQRRWLALLCILLGLLQALDLHSSLYAAKQGRCETNPLILWLIAHIGLVPALIAFKSTALAVVAGYYRVVRRFSKTLWPSMSLIPVCAAYVAVVLNNYS